MQVAVAANRPKQVAKAVRAAALRLAGRALAPAMRYVALYGYGTEACVSNGFLPLPVHFYAPVPDVDDLDRRGIWRQRSALSGIDFRPARQLAYLHDLAARFAHECRFAGAPTGDESEFHLANSNFSFGCAASLHCMIRDNRPRRVVEIGSGNSSKIISRALSLNARDGGPPADYTIVDPYPSPFTRDRLAGVTRVIADRVELSDPDLCSSLGSNDILFIDSGHTVRVGGDVNFLFLDVLPRLAPGVIVHVHDVNLPFEYEREYYAGQEGTFRRLWTESYLLQAFLACNRDYEVLLAMRYLMVEHESEFRRAFPQHEPAKHPALSSSFWIRRVGDSLMGRA